MSCLNFFEFNTFCSWYFRNSYFWVIFTANFSVTLISKLSWYNSLQLLAWKGSTFPQEGGISEPKIVRSCHTRHGKTKKLICYYACLLFVGIVSFQCSGSSLHLSILWIMSVILPVFYQLSMYLSACCYNLLSLVGHFYGLEQANKLQWTLAFVPLIKALQLTLSFLFWYVLVMLIDGVLNVHCLLWWKANWSSLFAFFSSSTVFATGTRHPLFFVCG